jgi:succinyl-CoA synthetase beta subunit
LKLYEYEAKAILSSYGIATPRSMLVATSQQALEATEKFGVPVVIKAQVLIAGRGKAGGILFADSPYEAEKATEKLLKNSLNGEVVKEVLVEEKISVGRELYFGLTVDRLNRCYATIASDLGGVNIEEIAQKQPNRIHRHLVNPKLGFKTFNAVQIAKELGYVGEKMENLAQVFMKIYQAALDCDAELAESNPLAETSDGRKLSGNVLRTRET